MVQTLECLREIATEFDAIVFDQWGVLHDGSNAYPGVPETIAALRGCPLHLAVLTNSGKRADLNSARLESMGYRAGLFDTVMSSGEAFWADIASGALDPGAMFPIQQSEGDAERWARGLPIRLTENIREAGAVLLMGIPEGGAGEAEREILRDALARKITLYCSNPDRASPRSGGRAQLSPGTLAHEYKQAGGDTIFYGKPYAPVFRALGRELQVSADRILMVGDSCEHDIAGAHAVGWKTLFVQGGLHATEFVQTGTIDSSGKIASLAAISKTPPPNYTIFQVR
jgi:HAD superfamily hydrolase (TIGR01459 family)